MRKPRAPFLPTILVIILGVNLGAWTLSVATAPGTSIAPLSIPVSAQGIDAQSQAASALAAQENPQEQEIAQEIPVAVPDESSPPTDNATTSSQSDESRMQR